MGPIFDPSAMDLGPTSWLIVVYHTYATPSLPALIPSSRKGVMKQVDKEERGGEKVVGMVVQ